MKKGRILFADNRIAFLNTRKEFLEAEGYEVLAAGNPDEARAILENGYVHLAIIDLRLTDDSPDDISGLILVRETGPIIPKIVLTAYPTWQAVRDALGTGIEGLSPAVDFVSKDDGPEAMIQAVRRAFTNQIHINGDLAIDWKARDHFSLVNLIESGLEGERLLNRAEELEDLFRRLFYEKSQITIDRLLWQRKGRIALVVFTFASDKPSESVIVVCGPPTRILDEWQRYGKFAPSNAGASNATLAAVGECAETTHFAAYALAGAPLESTQTLAEFYHSNPDQKSIRGAVDSLRATLVAWHRGERVTSEREAAEPRLFRERIGLDELGRSGLEGRILALQTEAAAHGLTLNVTDDVLTLHLSGGYTFSYANPLTHLYAPNLEDTSKESCAIAPGTLTPNNILIAPEGRAWLTDFADVGPAPLLSNFTELEAAIRFDLVESDNLLGLHEMERRLTEPGRIGQVDSRDVDRPIRVALQSIALIRQAASGLMDRDARSYHLGLLFQATGRVAAFQPGARRTRKEVALALHALLAAGMICERVLNIDRDDSTNDPAGIWIDIDNQVVQVDGKEKQLTPTEFKLLAYLYKHVGQLCSRKDVFQHVWENETYDPTSSSRNSRLDANADRLRKKIELDHTTPRYLFVERGVGYRLFTQPRK